MVSLCSKWSGIDKLSLYYTDEGSSKVIKEVGWNIDLQNTITRKLFHETHNIFQDFQDVCSEGVVGKNSVLSFSRQYRAVLQSCMIKLKDKIAREKREQLLEVMSGQIYGLVAQGRLSEVIDLLAHHPYKEEGRFDVFASIEELLSTMPDIELAHGHLETTFDTKWNLWQSECSARLNNGDFTDYPELEELCQLLNGDESTLLQNDICSTWYQLMVYKLLFCNPTVKTSNLKASAVESMEQMNGIGCVAELDEIILSILSLDVHKFIEKCSEVMTNWWFSVHLADLLYHYGMLKTYELNYGDELRTFLLLEHGSSLMSHPCLWHIGGDYLLSCGTQGRAMLENFVEKIPIESEKKALKLIHFCNKYNLVEQQLSICKTMGMKALHRKRFGVALSWCLRSKDELFASQLTDKYLEHYMATGTFIQCDIIENLGSQMLLNNKLTFLAKYYEFHQLYISKDYKAAATLLVSLLMSSIAPRKFWMTLLIDSLPLLQHDELMFSYEQTFELMQSLAELKLCHNISDSDYNGDNKKKLPEWDSEKIQLLHLALCKNLSRSSLLEPESIMPVR